MNNFLQNKKINVNELCNINIENLFNTNQNTHIPNPNDTIINNKIILNVNNLIESKSFKCNVDDNYIIKKIKNIEIDEKKFKLEAEILGDTKMLSNDVKAVTYNEMIVEEKRGKWISQVVLDV